MESQLIAEIGTTEAAERLELAKKEEEQRKAQEAERLEEERKSQELKNFTNKLLRKLIITGMTKKRKKKLMIELKDKFS